MAVTVQTRSLLQYLSDFVKEATEQSDEFALSDLIEEAESRFIDDDEFREAAVRDAVRQLLPQVVREIVRGRRGMLETAAGAVRASRIEKTARERLASIFESPHRDGHFVNALALRKPDIALLVDNYDVQIRGLHRAREGWAALARLLPNNSVTVGDLPSAKLDRVWREHFAPIEPAE